MKKIKKIKYLIKEKLTFEDRTIDYRNTSYLSEEKDAKKVMVEYVNDHKAQTKFLSDWDKTYRKGLRKLDNREIVEVKKVK